MKHPLSLVLAAAALLLTACSAASDAPARVPPTVDAFLAPGDATPLVPTRTATHAAMQTVLPSATPHPPTATTAPATATATRPAGTPTPTPVSVNGQPRMWWVDQMVKQPDGSFMAPEAVRQAIRNFVIEHNQGRTIQPGQDWQSTARSFYGRIPLSAERYYIGPLRKLVIETESPQVRMIVTGTVSVPDVRAFSADGMTAHVLVDFSAVTVVAFSTRDWSLLDSNYKVPSPLHLWRVRFDTADGRWKYEDGIASYPQ